MDDLLTFQLDRLIGATGQQPPVNRQIRVGVRCHPLRLDPIHPGPLPDLEHVAVIGPPVVGQAVDKQDVFSIGSGGKVQQGLPEGGCPTGGQLASLGIEQFHHRAGLGIKAFGKDAHQHPLPASECQAVMVVLTRIKPPMNHGPDLQCHRLIGFVIGFLFKGLGPRVHPEPPCVGGSRRARGTQLVDARRDVRRDFHQEPTGDHAGLGVERVRLGLHRRRGNPRMVEHQPFDGFQLIAFDRQLGFNAALGAHGMDRIKPRLGPLGSQRCSAKQERQDKHITGHKHSSHGIG